MTPMVGTKVRLTVEFANTAGTLGDPSTIGLDVRDGNGDIAQYAYPATVTKSSTGIYYCDVSCDVPGDWSYVWTATGSIEAVNSGSFRVKARPFDPPPPP